MFTPPILEDSESTRKARLFFQLVAGSALIVTAAIIITIFVLPQNLLRWLLIIGVVDVSSIGLLLVNRKGHTRIASFLFVGMWISSVFMLAWSTGGSRAPAIHLIPVVVLVAGLMLGWKQGVLTGLVAVLGSLGFVVAENAHILPVSTVVHTPLSLWIIVVLCIGLLAFLQYLSVATLDVVTETKLAEDTLRESDQKYRDLYDSAIEGIFDTSPEGRLLNANKAFAEILGFESAEEAIATLTDVAHQLYLNPNDRKVATDIIREKGFLKNFETQMRKKDGSVFWAFINARLNCSPDGRPYFQGFIADVTERKLVEQKLGESDARFRFIADNTADVTWTLSLKTGKFTYVSNSVQKLRGYTPEEILNQTMTEALTPESLQRVTSLLQEGLATGKPGDEARLKRIVLVDQPCKDGTVVSTEVAATVVFDKQGQPIDIVGVSRDITERKRSEGILRASEERFRRMFQHSATGMVVVSPNFYFLQVNEAFCNMLGYTESELLGKTFQDVTVPEDRPVGGELVSGVLSGKADMFYVEKRYRHKNGSVVWGHVSATLIRDNENKPLHFITQIQDITARKRVEEALRESEKYVHSVITAAPVVLWDLDSAGTILLSEGNALTHLGLKAGQLVGRSVFEVNKNDPQSLALIARGLAGEEFSVEVEIAGRYWSNQYVPRRDEKGKVVGLFGVSLDVTERKLAEEEYAKLQDQLIQSRKMESVGQLAGGVTHDFNNLLTVVLGYTELALLQVEPGQPLFSELQEIRKAVRRSADLTQQLLAFARKQTLAPRVMDLNTTVEGILKMLRRLIGEQVTLAWQPCVSVCPIKTDPSQIDQILTNLCVNARDAIAGVGKITIGTGIVALDKPHGADHSEFTPGDFVMLTVSDDGCGMDKETLDKIFEPFFTTKGIGRGTGLGLATVYSVVKQNNGSIQVHSEPGLGTTFKIYLPMYEAFTEHTGQKSTAAPVARGHETILLVEDDLVILDVATKILESFGYQVLAASTPGDALRKAKEHAGDIRLLITDVVMPEMNGRELAKNLSALYPEIRQMFMSGYASDVIARYGGLNEGVNFIQKPFSTETLAAQVREALSAPIQKR